MPSVLGERRLFRFFCSFPTHLKPLRALPFITQTLHINTICGCRKPNGAFSPGIRVYDFKSRLDFDHIHPRCPGRAVFSSRLKNEDQQRRLRGTFGIDWRKTSETLQDRIGPVDWRRQISLYLFRDYADPTVALACSWFRFREL